MQIWSRKTDQLQPGPSLRQQKRPWLDWAGCAGSDGLAATKLGKVEREKNKSRVGKDGQRKAGMGRDLSSR
jgi:hypothetical protein